MSETTQATIDPVCLALLIDPQPSRAIEALRVALVVLAAVGHIEIDATQGSGSFVRVQHAPAATMPGHIAAVYRALRDSARNDRLSRETAQTALVQAFGPRFRNYADATVVPALVERGLLRIETVRLLGLFPSRRLRCTATGDAAAKRLARQLAALDGLPQLLDRDPTLAVKLARDAGPLLMLSPAARSAIPRLQALAPAAAHGAAYTLVEEPEAEWLDLFEHLEMVMTIEFDRLLDAIDAIAEFGGDGGAGSSSDGGGDGAGGDGGGD